MAPDPDLVCTGRLTAGRSRQPTRGTGQREAAAGSRTRRQAELGAQGEPEGSADEGARAAGTGSGEAAAAQTQGDGAKGTGSGEASGPQGATEATVPT